MEVSQATCIACPSAPGFAELARRWLGSLPACLGDACQAGGDLLAARQAWQQAPQIRNDLGLPDNHGIGARLEQATPPLPHRLVKRGPALEPVQSRAAYSADMNTTTTTGSP